MSKNKELFDIGGVRSPAAIFDLDGLLADTEPIWSRSAEVLLSRRGKTYDRSLKPTLLGRHPLEVAGIMVRHYGLAGESPEALLRERLAVLRDLYTAGPVAPMPGARSLVRELRDEGWPMAVASGSPTALVREVLARLGLTDAFGVAVGSDQVPRGKPAPDLFLLAARTLSVPPRCCVVLEDAPAGVEAARAAGMACVLVPEHDLGAAAARAHLVVRSLEELSPARLRSLVPPLPQD